MKPGLILLGLVSLCAVAHADDARPGLTVVEGRIHKDGKPYRAFGVNYCDLFEELIHDPLGERTLDGLRFLGEKGIPYVRFWSCGFWPSDWDLYFEDGDEWFRRMDLVIGAAEEADVGLIPSMFWRAATYPDLFDEYADAWGDPESRTQQFMRTYVGEVVARYRDSPAIWGWEFANEMNLGCDLPNGMEFLGVEIPHLKVNVERHERNLVTYEAAEVAFRAFAEEVRKHDDYRFITTGNSEPRPYAYHNRTEGSWEADTVEEAREVYRWMNPPPMNVVSMHFYPKLGEDPIYADAEGVADVLAFNASLARELGMPLFVGEFSASASDKDGELSMEQFKQLQTEILDGIVASGADLAAHWVFDYSADIEAPGLIRKDNAYSWVLDQLVEYNDRLATDQLRAVATAHGRPGGTGSLRRGMTISDESREYFRRLQETPAFGADGFDLEGLRQGMATRREPQGMAAVCKPADVGGLPAEWVLAEGADPNRRLLYLHGGGYVSGSGAFYLTLAARLSAAGQCAVLLPDYRLAPEHRFPAGLEDCIRAYEWLRTSGPTGPSEAEAVFVAGDSAGGGLALATLLALRDRQRPLPAGAIALSPFADLTLAGESIRSEAELDPIMHPRALPEFVSRYVDQSDVRNPLASPVFGDYTGIPPLLIQVGEHEIIRDDSIRTAAKAKAAGVDVTLEVWEGMFHVFQSHEPLLPEGREAIESIARFMRSRLAP